jgi:hypothetical protein
MFLLIVLTTFVPISSSTEDLYNIAPNEISIITSTSSEQYKDRLIKERQILHPVPLDLYNIGGSLIKNI